MIDPSMDHPQDRMVYFFIFTAWGLGSRKVDNPCSNTHTQMILIPWLPTFWYASAASYWRISGITAAARITDTHTNRQTQHTKIIRSNQVENKLFLLFLISWDDLSDLECRECRGLWPFKYRLVLARFRYQSHSAASPSQTGRSTHSTAGGQQVKTIFGYYIFENTHIFVSALQYRHIVAQ